MLIVTFSEQKLTELRVMPYENNNVHGDDTRVDFGQVAQDKRQERHPHTGNEHRERTRTGIQGGALGADSTTDELVLPRVMGVTGIISLTVRSLAGSGRIIRLI